MIKVTDKTHSICHSLTQDFVSLMPVTQPLCQYDSSQVNLCYCISEHRACTKQCHQTLFAATALNSLQVSPSIPASSIVLFQIFLGLSLQHLLIWLVVENYSKQRWLVCIGVDVHTKCSENPLTCSKRHDFNNRFCEETLPMWTCRPSIIT
jgi:hypothetical protein